MRKSRRSGPVPRSSRRASPSRRLRARAPPPMCVGVYARKTSPRGARSRSSARRPSPTRSRQRCGRARGAPRSPSGSTAPCRATGRHRRRRRGPDRDATRLGRRAASTRLRQRFADRALVDERTGSLVGTAEEDVRGTPDPQPRRALPREARRHRHRSSRAASRYRRACLPRGPTRSRRAWAAGGVRLRTTSMVGSARSASRCHRTKPCSAASASLRGGSRSAQATMSNESKARRILGVLPADHTAADDPDPGRAISCGLATNVVRAAKERGPRRARALRPRPARRAASRRRGDGRGERRTWYPRRRRRPGQYAGWSRRGSP